MKAVLVVAARPNFVKIRSVLDALELRGVECVLVHTGQHYDKNLSDVFFRDLGIRSPDRHLDVGSGSHASQTGRVMVAFEAVVDAERPDAVVVVGDVNSTLACALVGAKSGVAVAHLEAGLRSRDWGMPEEINRVVADRVSDLLLAPSADAVDNLRLEGYRADQIALVGNVMIDTLLANLERARSGSVREDIGIDGQRFGLVTLHRPSNVDVPRTLASLMSTLGELACELPLVFPVHPRTRERLVSSDVHPGILLTDPLGYLDFLALEDAADLVLTDSGGVQEETTVLGTPCLTLRDSTERPVTVTEGTNTVVGTDREAILAVARARLAGDFEVRHPPLWDGKAGARSADALLALLQNGNRMRPTDLPDATNLDTI